MLFFALGLGISNPYMCIWWAQKQFPAWSLQWPSWLTTRNPIHSTGNPRRPSSIPSFFHHKTPRNPQAPRIHPPRKALGGTWWDQTAAGPGDSGESDLLCTPTAACTAPGYEAKSPQEWANEPTIPITFPQPSHNLPRTSCKKARYVMRSFWQFRWWESNL